jgi:hypothetical protein
LPFQREKNDNFLDLQSVIFEPFANLNTGPSDLFPSDVSGASKWQGTLSFQSSVLLRACLFYPRMRVFRWHVDPEC